MDSRRIVKLGAGVDRVTRHVWPLSDHGQKVKGQGHKVTYRISSNNAITRQRMVVSTSNLARGETCAAFSRSVGQLDRK